MKNETEVRYKYLIRLLKEEGLYTPYSRAVWQKYFEHVHVNAHPNLKMAIKFLIDHVGTSNEHLRNIINASFTWSRTNEGWRFWNEEHNKFYNILGDYIFHGLKDVAKHHCGAI